MSQKITSIIFFGTPEFAVPALKALINADFCEVTLVVTQPDKPVGRHHSTSVPSPVKQIAQEAGIRVITPNDKSRHAELVSASVFDSEQIPKQKQILKQVQDDVVRDDVVQLGILVAYGAIIPQKLIDAFPLGILNIHPSLLPKYRGSSPIQAAILNQDKETGVTLMQLDDTMDHGPIIAQEKITLAGTEAAGDAHDKLAILGAELLLKTLPDYIAGNITPRPQDESKATYTKKVFKADGEIDWKKSPEEIQALVRAMNPWPGAWTTWQEKKLIILKASLVRHAELVSASVFDSEQIPKQKQILKQVQDDVVRDDVELRLEEVQLENKKRMSFGEFMRGHPDFKLSDCA